MLEDPGPPRLWQHHPGLHPGLLGLPGLRGPAQRHLIHQQGIVCTRSMSILYIDRQKWIRLLGPTVLSIFVTPRISYKISYFRVLNVSYHWIIKAFVVDTGLV